MTKDAKRSKPKDSYKESIKYYNILNSKENAVRILAVVIYTPHKVFLSTVIIYFKC